MIGKNTFCTQKITLHRHRCRHFSYKPFEWDDEMKTLFGYLANIKWVDVTKKTLGYLAFIIGIAALVVLNSFLHQFIAEQQWITCSIPYSFLPKFISELPWNTCSIFYSLIVLLIIVGLAFLPTILFNFFIKKVLITKTK